MHLTGVQHGLICYHARSQEAVAAVLSEGASLAVSLPRELAIDAGSEDLELQQQNSSQVMSQPVTTGLFADEDADPDFS